MKSLPIIPIALCIALCLAGGCVYPSTDIRTGDNRPMLGISGAPVNAVLIVDGLAMGDAKKYDGKKQVLLLEPGVHMIEVRHYGEILFSEKMFLSDKALKIITINN
jgi:hypothetical protein